MKSGTFFRMSTICANVEARPSVLWKSGAALRTKRYRALQKLVWKEVSGSNHALEKKSSIQIGNTKAESPEMRCAEITNSMNPRWKNLIR